ncbi:hypothetical protein LguiB_027218 [Lonicera macranthoides]
MEIAGAAMEAALGAVVGEAAKITDALIQERAFLNEVERQIKWIEKELRLMRATAEQEPVAGEAPSKWAEEEQDLVRELNDIADIFFIRRRKSRLRSFFARNKMAMRVEKLKVKIRQPSEIKTREEAISLMAISTGDQLEASNSVICVIIEANTVLSQNLLVIGGVSKQVEDMRDEFFRLLVFLKNIHEKGELSRRTKAWSRQVLEVSEPTINLFQLFTGERKEQLLENFNMSSLILNDLKFGRDINGIHAALQNIYERRWRYGVGDHIETSERPNSLNPNKHVKKISIPSVYRLYGLGMNLVPLCAVVKIRIPRLKKKLALWRPVQNQLKSISQDLELMQALIDDVQGKEGLDQRVLVWVDEIKDIKCHAVDLLDLASYNPEQGTARGFLRLEIRKKIKQIKHRIDAVSERKWTYDIGRIQGNFNHRNQLQEGESSSNEGALTTWNTVESIKWELKLMKALFADVAPINDQDERVKLWVEIMQSVANDAQKLIDTYDTITMAERAGYFRRCLFTQFKMPKLIEKIHVGLHEISRIKSTYAIGGIEGRTGQNSTDGTEGRRGQNSTDGIEARRSQNSTDEIQHEILPTASSISETPSTCTSILTVLKIDLLSALNRVLEVESVGLIKNEKRLMDALFKDVGDQERLDSIQKDWVQAMQAVANYVNSAIEIHNEMTGLNICQRLLAAEKIKFVSGKIQDLPRRVPYDMKHIKRGGEPDNNTAGSQHQATPRSFGLEQLDISLYDDRQAVKAQLLIHSEHHYITFIVGMEGIGKTTLANSICKDVDVIHRFPHRALVSIPSYKNFGALVNDIEEQLTVFQEQKTKEIVGVNGSHMLDANTCLIVLEDVRTIKEWKELIKEFPSTFNGIRILATTRSLDVAKDTGSVSHKMHLLSDDDSWFLFKRSLTIPPGVKDQDIRKKVLIPCGGLPKAILEVREKFSQVECTSEAWLHLLETVQRNQEPWQETIRIYNREFPLDLRPYLFIIAQFPTDFEIPVRRLTALWIAESSTHRWRGNFEEPPESVAKNHLTGLIDRNMVQVTKKKLNGEVKRCRLPHPLQEIRTSKVSHLVDYYNPGDSIFKHIHGGNEYISPSSLSDYNDVISFTSFDPREGITPGEELGKFLNICISSRCFKLLRVLDLEHVFRPELPEAIGNLDELRYLGLRWTYLQNLPPFISKLLNLQILDVKHTSISTLPRSIWKMHKLRHLYLNESYRCRLPPPQSLRTITDLQTLWGVFIDEESPVENGLDRLLSVKRLGLTSRLMASGNQYAMSRKLEAVADWVNRLKKLQSLRLKSLDEPNQPLDLHLKPLKGHTNLSTIYLLGRISNEFVASGLPMALTDLTLSGSGLKEDPMQTLEKLPSLKILRLLGDTFIGTHMLCSSGGFLQLRVLKIWKLMQLEEWELREGALPNLIDLEIRSCIKLKVLPNGLLFLSTLSTLKLSGMPKEFIHTIKVRQKLTGELIDHRADYEKIYEGEEKVSMSSDSPVPAIAVTWSENRDPCIEGWQTPYKDRIKIFKDLVGQDVATRESFPKGEETVGNENKDGYQDNGAAAKECSKDSMIPNTNS